MIIKRNDGKLFEVISNDNPKVYVCAEVEAHEAGYRRVASGGSVSVTKAESEIVQH